MYQIDILCTAVPDAAAGRAIIVQVDHDGADPRRERNCRATATRLRAPTTASDEELIITYPFGGAATRVTGSRSEPFIGWFPACRFWCRLSSFRCWQTEAMSPGCMQQTSKSVRRISVFRSVIYQPLLASQVGEVLPFFRCENSTSPLGGRQICMSEHRLNEVHRRVFGGRARTYDVFN